MPPLHITPVPFLLETLRSTFKGGTPAAEKPANPFPAAKLSFTVV